MAAFNHGESLVSRQRDRAITLQSVWINCAGSGGNLGIVRDRGNNASALTVILKNALANGTVPVIIPAKY
jgi:hypothetical protein